MIKVINEKCPQDHICPLIIKCPVNTITQEGYNAPKVNSAKCIECLICVNTCPHNCFEKE